MWGFRGLGVRGLGFFFVRVWGFRGLGFGSLGVWGFRVWGLGFRVPSEGTIGFYNRVPFTGAP